SSGSPPRRVSSVLPVAPLAPPAAPHCLPANFLLYANPSRPRYARLLRRPQATKSLGPSLCGIFRVCGCSRTLSLLACPGHAECQLPQGILAPSETSLAGDARDAPAAGSRGISQP